MPRKNYYGYTFSISNYGEEKGKPTAEKITISIIKLNESATTYNLGSNARHFNTIMTNVSLQQTNGQDHHQRPEEIRHFYVSIDPDIDLRSLLDLNEMTALLRKIYKHCPHGEISWSTNVLEIVQALEEAGLKQYIWDSRLNAYILPKEAPADSFQIWEDPETKISALAISESDAKRRVYEAFLQELKHATHRDRMTETFSQWVKEDMPVQLRPAYGTFGQSKPDRRSPRHMLQEQLIAPPPASEE